MLRANPMCYGCGWFKECKQGTILMEKCMETDYSLWCSEADRELCNMLCNDVEEDKEEDD